MLVGVLVGKGAWYAVHAATSAVSTKKHADKLYARRRLLHQSQTSWRNDPRELMPAISSAPLPFCSPILQVLIHVRRVDRVCSIRFPQRQCSVFYPLSITLLPRKAHRSGTSYERVPASEISDMDRRHKSPHKEIRSPYSFWRLLRLFFLLRRPNDGRC